MRRMLTKVRGFPTRDPFIVFLIVAAAIFLLYWSVTESRAKIEVTVAAQKSLSDDYEMMTGSKPDPAARKKLIDDYVTNELLFREAVARGLHMSDKTTKQRLIDRVRFMIAGAPDDPSEDALLGFYARNPQLYRSEPRMTVHHVFFERAPPADAANILARLNAGAKVEGEEFWMGHDLPDYGISMLRGMFGQPFLDAIGKVPVGKWNGPVKSIRGWHFVQVSDRGEARMLPYAQARGQVLQDYNVKQTSAVVQKEIARLKEDVDVEIK